MAARREEELIVEPMDDGDYHEAMQAEGMRPFDKASASGMAASTSMGMASWSHGSDDNIEKELRVDSSWFKSRIKVVNMMQHDLTILSSREGPIVFLTKASVDATKFAAELGREVRNIQHSRWATETIVSGCSCVITVGLATDGADVTLLVDDGPELQWLCHNKHLDRGMKLRVGSLVPPKPISKLLEGLLAVTGPGTQTEPAKP